jgi:hypothetical protein
MAISAFLVLHLSGILVINLPPSPLRAMLWWPVCYYLVPVGLDQSWGMFAPNPVPHPATIEVLTVDKDGIQRIYSFPRMTDYSWWEAVPKVRHSKFASQLAIESNSAHREFATRYALRQLRIPASSYPVEAEMTLLRFETPSPGSPLRDPLTPPIPATLSTYRFPTIAEVTP